MSRRRQGRNTGGKRLSRLRGFSHLDLHQVAFDAHPPRSAERLLSSGVAFGCFFRRRLRRCCRYCCCRRRHLGIFSGLVLRDPVSLGR